MDDIVETRQGELKSKKICRFCLTQNASELSIIYSRENRMKTAPLPLQVMACVSIEVFSKDCMPGYVCNECRLIFDYCYRFKQMCKKADTCLRHYPLTGVWSPALDHPKMPAELLRKQTNVKKNLNALQVSKVKEVPETVEETRIEKCEDKSSTMTSLSDKDQNSIPKKDSTPKKRQPLEIEVEIDEMGDDANYIPKKVPVPLEKSARKTPVIKILNKSAIRILNKEAQKVIEPIMSKPVLQRDDDGNLAIVTQILEPETPETLQSVDKAAVLETNVFPCPHCERSFPLKQLLDIHLVNHNRARSFFCEFCDKSFFSKYDLQKHNLTHTGEKPYVCVVCQKGFTRSTLLHRHEKIHIDIPKYICVFCEKSFISQEEMEKHTDRHRKHRPYVCKICNKGFAFKQGLERHEIVHCRQQPFQCQYCDQSYSTPRKLSRHLTAHAGKRPYPCKLCPKSYLLSHHLTRHMRSHKNGSGSFKCNDCQKSFATRDDLIYHSAVHAAQTMVCPLCKDAFEDIETVTEHVRQHAEGEAFACEFCDFIYMTSDRLDDHIKAKHALEMVAYYEDSKISVLNENEDTNSTEKPNVCKICIKKFDSQESLENHECSQFQCQYCDQSFSTGNKLSKHMATHPGENLFKCTMCPKIYIQISHLTRHMRSHRNVSGSYTCNDCQKSFDKRDDLIYHSAIHAAQSMVCPLCKEAFKDIETVTAHVKQHAEGDGFACEFCDLIYMTPDRLEDHIQDVHASETVAYYVENKKSALNKNEDKNATENSNKEIDDVIEEFLYEEFSEEPLKVEANENVIIKDEDEWERQLDNENRSSKNNSHGSNENETIYDETLELMNIIEMNDDEPPVKIKKIAEKSKATTKVVATKLTSLRQKLPIKPVQLVSPSNSSSSSPKENKKPPKSTQKIMAVQNSVFKQAAPKTRQPTIQAALNAISKSVSIKRIETSNKSVVAPSTPKTTETETITRKSSPRVAAAKLESSEQSNVSKTSPNTNKRMLRQRGEVTVENKAQTKASPISAVTQKSTPKATEAVAVKKTEESPQEDKKLVEMVIDDKKVKVKKITMSKAQVAEMTRDGRIQMKGGTMILKKSRTSPNEVV